MPTTTATPAPGMRSLSSSTCSSGARPRPRPARPAAAIPPRTSSAAWRGAGSAGTRAGYHGPGGSEVLMLGRYKHQRYVPKPKGHWILTQWKNKTCVSPTEDLVNEYLNKVSDAAWEKYERTYLRILEERFSTDRQPFDELARLAREGDVHIGCSCPTKENPTHQHCHH